MGTYNQEISRSNLKKNTWVTKAIRKEKLWAVERKIKCDKRNEHGMKK